MSHSLLSASVYFGEPLIFGECNKNIFFFLTISHSASDMSTVKNWAVLLNEFTYNPTAPDPVTETECRARRYLSSNADQRCQQEISDNWRKYCVSDSSKQMV